MCVCTISHSVRGGGGSEGEGGRGRERENKDRIQPIEEFYLSGFIPSIL